MIKRVRALLMLVIFTIITACGQSTSVPTATSMPTDTPTPTETAVPTLTSTPTEVPREPTGPKAGTLLLYNDGSTLVYVPSGEFDMGSGDKKTLLHKVALQEFWIQKTEVTRAMFSNCMQANVCPEDNDFLKISYQIDSAYWNRPVTGVKYEQAQAYCAWIGGRLPTEAEWEYAARGTSGNTYPWGNEEPACDILNFNNCTGSAARVTNYQRDISLFGILGMAGNAREWVSDFFDSSYYENSPSQNPTGPAKSNYYVVRGGSFKSPLDEVKSFSRGFVKLKGSADDLGFRCVVDNPVTYAPYCEASLITTNEPETAPPDLCEPFIDVDPQVSCNVIHGDVTGGELISVVPITPRKVECEISDIDQISCQISYGGGGTLSVPVTACVVCSDITSISNPTLECPVNFTLAQTGNYCDYSGGAWPEHCPPNSTAINENQCVYQQERTEYCPMGSYFDQGMNGCVTIGQTPLTCMEGYRYDFDHSCCVPAQPKSELPTCKHSEYYDPDYGCVPLPQSGGIQSCGTVSLPIWTCR